MKRFLRAVLKFCGAVILRKTGMFDRFPELQWRGRIKVPFTPRTFNHSDGRITSTTDRVGRLSRNSRTGRTRLDLPGPLSWVSRRR